MRIKTKVLADDPEVKRLLSICSDEYRESIDGDAIPVREQAEKIRSVLSEMLTDAYQLGIADGERA